MNYPGLGAINLKALGLKSVGAFSRWRGSRLCLLDVIFINISKRTFYHERNYP